MLVGLHHSPRNVSRKHSLKKIKIVDQLASCLVFFDLVVQPCLRGLDAAIRLLNFDGFVSSSPNNTVQAGVHSQRAGESVRRHGLKRTSSGLIDVPHNFHAAHNTIVKVVRQPLRRALQNILERVLPADIDRQQNRGRKVADNFVNVWVNVVAQRVHHVQQETRAAAKTAEGHCVDAAQQRRCRRPDRCRALF